MSFSGSFSLWPHQFHAGRMSFHRPKHITAGCSEASPRHQALVLITSEYGDGGAGICTMPYLSVRTDRAFLRALGVYWAISQTRSPSQQQGKGGCHALRSLGQKPSKQHSWELAALPQNRKNTKDSPSAHRVFSKLVLAPYSKAISFGTLGLLIFMFLSVYTITQAAFAV